jgi:hypothetical protein
MTGDLLVPHAKSGRKHKKGKTVAERRTRRRSLDRDTALILDRTVRLMNHQNVTPTELARRSGMKRSNLYQILDPLRNARGSLRIDVIRALATGLRVSMHELIDP